MKKFNIIDKSGRSAKPYNNINSGCVCTTKELLEIWREQTPKIVYYE